MNVTYPTTLVLQALALGHRHGFDVMDATDLPSGTVYPILRRLEAEGLVRSRWERQEIAQREGRPPRRDYELTGAGEEWLAKARLRFRALASVPRPARLKPARGGA
jgi:DNA-binding PadR family transcriptional regulator